MTSVRRLTTGYIPRTHQQFLHARLKRFNFLVCHRRFGKSVFCIHEMIDRGIRNPRKNPQYAYIAPTFGAAKRIAWEYLKDAVKHIPGVDIKEGELKITIQRVDRQDDIRIFLLGAENPGAVRGIYLDGVVMDEFAEIDPSVWSQVVRPALSDRLGWAIVITTPKGSNHAHEMYRRAKQDTSGEWFTAMFKASDTGIISKEELESARAELSQEEYEQEYECSFTSALVGAYYKKEMALAEAQGRITNVPYDSHALVWTGWDLGIDDSTAIWFIQECGRELHVIDYWEGHSHGFDSIGKMLQEKPYLYAGHILPHDVAVRELSTGRSRLEILRQKIKLKNVVVSKRLRVEDGIAAVRMLLSRMWFDQDKCALGIEALKSYERKFDTKEGVFRAVPRHNWASHGADGLRSFAVGYRLEEDGVNVADLQREAEGDYNILDW